MATPTIALVEDDHDLRESLAHFVERCGLQVVGAFANAEEALASAIWPACAFLLVDLKLPGMSGVALIAEIRSRHPGVTAVVYTMHDDRETAFAALKAGAYGYLLKGASEEELRSGLEIMKQGGSPMSPSIARKVIEALHKPEEPVALSVREVEILRMVSRGAQAKEVADQLSLSTHTVYTHLRNIYGKLHVRSKSAAIRKAGRIGLV